MNGVAVRSDNLNILSICSGGGGLDLGFELAIPSARTVLYVERESFAVAHLVAAMQQGWLAEAPVWSDVTTLNGRPWRGLVDGLIGGIPCQPWSLAGKRAGTEDERDLWSDTRRIIIQSRPWFVVIENVRGMLTAKRGFDPGALRVWRDLRRLGFSVEAGLFTASEVGESHERERVFILGVAEWAAVGQANCEGRRWSNSEFPTEARASHSGKDRSGGSELPGVGQADTYSERPQGHGQSRQRTGECSVGPGGCELGHSSIARGGGLPILTRRQDEAGLNAHRAGGDVVYAASGCEPHIDDRSDALRLKVKTFTGAASGNSSWGSAARGWCITGGGETFRPLFPPGPADGPGWEKISKSSPELLPAVSRYDRFQIEIGNALTTAHGDPTARDWLDEKGPYGLRAEVVQEIAQSTLRQLADGVAESRTDWLRLLGNGVSPLQAGYAIRTLATRLAARGSSGAIELVRLMEIE